MSPRLYIPVVLLPLYTVLGNNDEKCSFVLLLSNQLDSNWIAILFGENMALKVRESDELNQRLCIVHHVACGHAQAEAVTPRRNCQPAAPSTLSAEGEAVVPFAEVVSTKAILTY